MKKVITYGTFDLFHKGHYNILKRAKEHGDYLIVGVTSESYDIERGKLSVRDSLTTRMENVRKTGFADEIIIEEYLGQKIRDIAKYDIDTLVIGSDWIGKFDHLRKYCNVVYLERTKNISSTMIRNEESNIFNVGIATDDDNDSDVILETKYVSGLNVSDVYSSDKNVAEKFCDRFELNGWETDYDMFLKKVDIVYVRCGLSSRYDLIKRALECGKSVIADSPVALTKKQGKELFELAEKNKCVFLENIITVYLKAFTQLLWMTQGDMRGNTIRVKCAISYDNFSTRNSFADLVSLSSCMIMKILGADYKKFEHNFVRNEAGEINYGTINFSYEDAVGFIEIGNGIELENRLVITGDQATITVKDDWWNTGYFELKRQDAKHVKRYSFNFEGNGFRYLLQELLIMIRDNRYECTRLFPSESLGIIDVLEKIKKG